MNKLTLFPSKYNEPCSTTRCSFEIDLDKKISDFLRYGSSRIARCTVRDDWFHRTLHQLTNHYLYGKYEIEISPIKLTFSVAPVRQHQPCSLKEYKNDLAHFLASECEGTLKQYLTIEGKLECNVEAFVYIELVLT